MDLIRPWNEARPNLAGKTLTAAERTWIGREAAQPGKTLESVAQWYRISPNNVNSWKNLVKKGTTIKETKGRPKCFDANSFASIETQIVAFGQNS